MDPCHSKPKSKSLLMRIVRSGVVESEPSIIGKFIGVSPFTNCDVTCPCDATLPWNASRQAAAKENILVFIIVRFLF